MQYVAPSAPQTIGGVLDDWLRLFRSTFSRCWALALVAAVISMAVQFQLAPWLPKPGASAVMFVRQTVSVGHAPQIFVGDLIMWLVLLAVYGALLTQQLAAIRGGGPLSFWHALATGLRRLPSMVAGAILLILIVVAVLLPVGLGVGVLIALRQAGHDPLPLILAVGSVSLILVLLLIYLGVRLEFWLPALMAENCGGAAALGHSWRVVKGHWWQVTAITFVAGIVIWIVSLAVGGTAGVLAGLFAAHGTSVTELLYRVRIGAAISQIGRVLTMPLFSAVCLVLYQDLKLRVLGADLATRVGALGTR